MSNDQTFRILLIIGAAVVFPIAVYHRVRSQATGERLDRRQEGWFILLTLRPVGIAAMLGLLAYMINPAWMRWSSMPLPVWLRWTGIGLGVLAGFLVTWTMHTLGRNLTDTIVTRKEHSLVTKGPYRWIRHPFYICVTLMMLANGLATTNWFILICGTLAVLLLVKRTPIEEQKLLDRFGDEYRAYAQRTGRFFPRIG